MVLAKKHNVSKAPFFVVEDGSKVSVYEVYFTLKKEVLGEQTSSASKSEEIARDFLKM